MAVNYYRSSDAGAPTIAYATAGSLLAVLKACLVDGYGSKVAAGWTMPFSGTNQAAFKMGGGSGRYVFIDDTPTAGYAQAIRGYETMSSLTSGTGMFPTADQVTDLSSRWWRSYSSGTPYWAVVAAENYFYLWVGSLSYGHIYFFGDIDAFDPADSYATMLATTGATSSLATSNGVGLSQAGLTYYSSGTAVARSYDGASTSWVQVGRHTDYVKNGSSTVLGTSGLAYPNGPDGSVYLAPVWVHEVNSAVYLRGLMPGLYCPCNWTSAGSDFVLGNVIEIPSGALAGRKFLVARPAGGSAGCALFDVTED